MNNSEPTINTTSEAPTDEPKLDSATIKQLRKNIVRLQQLQQIEAAKKATHFSITSFFPTLGKK